MSSTRSKPGADRGGSCRAKTPSGCDEPARVYRCARLLCGGPRTAAFRTLGAESSPSADHERKQLNEHGAGGIPDAAGIRPGSRFAGSPCNDRQPARRSDASTIRSPVSGPRNRSARRRCALPDDHSIHGHKNTTTVLLRDVPNDVCGGALDHVPCARCLSNSSKVTRTRAARIGAIQSRSIGPLEGQRARSVRDRRTAPRPPGTALPPAVGLAVEAQLNPHEALVAGALKLEQQFARLRLEGRERGLLM